MKSGNKKQEARNKLMRRSYENKTRTNLMKNWKEISLNKKKINVKWKNLNEIIKEISNDLLDQINNKRIHDEKIRNKDEEDYQQTKNQEYDDLLEKTKLLEQFKTKLKIAQIQKVDNSHYKQFPNPSLYQTYTQK
ncbi:hypothetical protein BCR36DRAFT_375936 [Piromyces finnis]|uniref:Uncharacterized protein n=1 Tax=Piromyces finnis TaxID=1754191 RepID=A0A1Y1U9W6_9FUNG|nr:hypothetical protein BCR36DRAFT_375936 [Piromyces finnis]|eukprot:ORX33875.1 hypothetical protein BCR36DRAFT_375936 [Piromyces finnis]